MEIEPPRYISYPEAVAIHLLLMRGWGEVRYGVADRTLVESALARPQQAAAYEEADLKLQRCVLVLSKIIPGLEAINELQLRLPKPFSITTTSFFTHAKAKPFRWFCRSKQTIGKLTK